MDWKDVANDWKAFEKPARERWRKLSDLHVQNIAGDRAALVAIIGRLYSFPPEQAEREVTRWTQRMEKPAEAESL